MTEREQLIVGVAGMIISMLLIQNWGLANQVKRLERKHP